MSKTKYLISGGAGFIGANFVKYLLDKYDSDIELVVVDALTYAGNLSTIGEEIGRDNVEFVRADIRDRKAMNGLMVRTDPDFIVNFAAESHVDRSISDPGIFLETNILGTQSLLDAARAVWQTGDGKWREGKKFLQISTDEVYGALQRDYEHAHALETGKDLCHITEGRTDLKTFGKDLFTEETPLAPRSPYSASKASADMVALAYHETYGMPMNITRCSNNYGPWQFPEKLIPLIINNIREGRQLPVYGRGLNVRDWLYVDDHCSAIDTVLRQGKEGEIYNIGGLNEQQNIDIVETVVDLVAEMTGTEARHDLIAFVRDRAGHDMRYAIDPSKTARELGWYPRTPFAEGIRETVAWYLANDEWIKSVTSGEYREYYDRMYKNR